jgi:DNA-binding response OmpR family regulator
MIEHGHKTKHADPNDTLEQGNDIENGVRGGSAQVALRFRHYHVEPSARVLLRDGQPIELGSRAFDLLLTLLESRGVLVPKEELIRKVWPDTVVDECNLRFQMVSLRNALGEDRDIIKTIPGRGYLLADEDGAGNVVPRMHTKTAQFMPGNSMRRHLRVNSKLTTDGHANHDKPTVAIIDDDSGSREALHDLLESAGLRVESFESTQAYLGRVPSVSPDCLVLDVFLPGQSGLDFQNELAYSGVYVPIIFISGHADVHMSVQAMKAGAFEFLTKPVRYQEFLDAVSLAISFRLGKASSCGDA